MIEEELIRRFKNNNDVNGAIRYAIKESRRAMLEEVKNEIGMLGYNNPELDDDCKNAYFRCLEDVITLIEQLAQEEKHDK